MKKIVIHYPYIPSYRIPIFSLLNNSKKNNYIFWADTEFSDKYMDLGKSNKLNLELVKTISFRLPLFNGLIEIQLSALKKILFEDIDIYITMANPYSPTMWLTMIIARIRGIYILNWTHGYKKPNTGWRGIFKRIFYKLPNGFLLYGNKAKVIMKNEGISENKLHVIYNSLDYNLQKENREKLTYDDRVEVRNTYGFNENSIVLIAIGRLLKKLKLHEVIQAIKNETDLGKDINLLLIGDGEEKKNLENLTNKLNINKRVSFIGACHDENTLARLYNASDYSIVMGKVGLSAMHSLAYGIPMITNNNTDEHFPEIEAIVNNKSGFYFKENDLDDFCSKIKSIDYRGDYYYGCIDIIERDYTPGNQFNIIEKIINDV